MKRTVKPRSDFQSNLTLLLSMVAAAVEKANELCCTVNIVVIDDGGRLVDFARMDGAPVPAIDGCQRKAFYALFCMGTQNLFDAITPKDSMLLRNLLINV